MNTKTSLASQIALTRFTAAHTATGLQKHYALALSSEPQAVSFLGGMEWDAQAGFFSLAGNKKGKEPKFDAESCFAQEPSPLRTEPLIGFVPKDQEEQALAAFRRLFERWTKGQERDMGYFGHGSMAMGFKFTPSGMIFAIGADADVQDAPHLDRAWREERLLDSGLSVVNAKERAFCSMGPRTTGKFEKIDFTRQSTILPLTTLADVSSFLQGQNGVSTTVKVPDWMKKDSVFEAMSRAPAVQKGVLNANDPIVAEFVSFLRCEVDARSIKDAMAASSHPKKDLASTTDLNEENSPTPVAARKTRRL